MIDAKERARRDNAHLEADMAWSRDGKRSRVDGLGELVRSIGASKAVPVEVRKMRQDLHRSALRRLYDRIRARG